MRMDETKYFNTEKSSDFGRDEQGRLLSPSEIMFGKQVLQHDLAGNSTNVFKQVSASGQKKVAEGSEYCRELLGDSPIFYKYSNDFPEYGVALFAFMTKVKSFEAELDKVVEKSFGSVSSLGDIKTMIIGLYRKQVSEVVKKQEIALAELWKRSDDVYDKHDMYEDKVLADAAVGDHYRESGETPPERYLDAEKLLSDEGVVEMKNEHTSILSLIDEQVRVLSRGVDLIDLQTYIFLATFKSLIDSGIKIDLESVSQAGLTFSGGLELSADDITFMRSVYSDNQIDSAVHDQLLSGFDKKVKDPKTQFSIFRWQNKIQSFLAFTDKGDSLYMSAFNVSPDARGFKIGEVMLDQVVNEQAKERVLEADCDVKLPISAKYIETGWIGTFYWEDKNEKEGKSDWVIDIKRDDKINAKYWGKGASKESIVTQRTHPENVKVEVATTQAELPFHYLQEGYVLTRMFTDTSGLCYGVFELPTKENLVTNRS